MTPPQTRFEANQILTMWKLGLHDYPPHIISMALWLTGDLVGRKK